MSSRAISSVRASRVSLGRSGHVGAPIVEPSASPANNSNCLVNGRRWSRTASFCDDGLRSAAFLSGMRVSPILVARNPRCAEKREVRWWRRSRFQRPRQKVRQGRQCGHPGEGGVREHRSLRTRGAVEHPCRNSSPRSAAESLRAHRKTRPPGFSIASPTQTRRSHHGCHRYTSS